MGSDKAPGHARRKPLKSRYKRLFLCPPDSSGRCRTRFLRESKRPSGWIKRDPRRATLPPPRLRASWGVFPAPPAGAASPRRFWAGPGFLWCGFPCESLHPCRFAGCHTEGFSGGERAWPGFLPETTLRTSPNRSASFRLPACPTSPASPADTLPLLGFLIPVVACGGSWWLLFSRSHHAQTL